MKKNILVINTGEDIIPLFDFFDELTSDEFDFFFMESGVKALQKIKERNWQYKKIKKRNKFNLFLFLLFWPINFLIWLIKLLYFKYKKNIQYLVLINKYEKLTVTPAAKVLKIKIIWLETPGEKFKDSGKLNINLFRLISRWVVIVTLNGFSKQKLEKLKFKNVFNMKLGNHARQDNIFNNIAKRGQSRVNNKFFTVGTTLIMDDLQKIEAMFQAMKKCISIIPQLQFIVIGDGEKRKNFLWLAKRMEINNFSWFVGHQECLKKWLDGFDVFCCADDHLNLNNLSAIIQALVSGLPVVGPNNIGLEEIFYNKNQILTVKPENAEDLAQEIIRVYKNRYLNKKMTKNQEIYSLFSGERIGKKFKKILK